MTTRRRIATDPKRRSKVTRSQEELGGRYVAGSVLAAFVHDLALEHFGWPWVERGSLSVVFQRPIMDGDEIEMTISPSGDQPPSAEVRIRRLPDGEEAVTALATLEEEGGP